MSKKYLYWDLETHNAGREYSMEPREFVRLAQYAWNDGPVTLTSDYDEIREAVLEADYIVGHNIIAADVSWLFGRDAPEPMILALQKRIIDTFYLAHLVDPAPAVFTDQNGHTHYDGGKPEKAMKWLSLGNLTHQYGLPGKFGDLKEIAKRFNPPKTLVRDLDFGLIDVNDEEFRFYAEQDVIAVRALYKHLLQKLKDSPVPGEYVWREMVVASINAQITRNGWVVDTDKAQARVDALAKKRDEIMDWLVKEYDFPTEGKSPWASAAGKEVIFKVLADHGITPETHDWPETATGNPSLSSDALVSLTKGTELEEMGSALAALKGQRSLAQLALESTHPDGRVHPQITALQRSGRTSTTRPGLTIWGAKEGLSDDKAYFVADPGCKLVEMDFSSADSRAVAALSGDPKFALRFDAPDAHDLTGEIFWDKDYYYANRAELRPTAKMAGHSMAYRVGAKTLAKSLGVDVDTAKGYIEAYNHEYSGVAAWQNDVTREGDSGWVTNSWGRRMRVDPDRSYTQSSGLLGQSTTRDVLFDGLIAIAEDKLEVLRWLKATIHDAVVWSIPETELDWAVEYILSKMEMDFVPHTRYGQTIRFTMEAGSPADNWEDASHG